MVVQSYRQIIFRAWKKATADEHLPCRTNGEEGTHPQVYVDVTGLNPVQASRSIDEVKHAQASNFGSSMIPAKSRDARKPV